jgi:DNA-binding MarR family transcriptional regulator
VQALRAQLEIRNIKSARERVWQTLLLTAGGQANTITFDRPLKDLAAEIGLTHEAFYRALAELEKAGRIRRARRRVAILGTD